MVAVLALIFVWSLGVGVAGMEELLGTFPSRTAQASLLSLRQETAGDPVRAVFSGCHC